MSLYHELKRRNVFRVGVAYVVTAWLGIQVAETIFPPFGFGDAAIRLVVIFFAIGLIPALIVSWVFEITPEGLKKDKDIEGKDSITNKTAKQLDRIIMVVLALALGYFAIDKFMLSPLRQTEELASATKEAHQAGRSEALVESYGDKSIAVLPFVNMSSDEEQEYFSDGITEELLNLLSKIPELRVISRSSAFSFKGKNFDTPTIAAQLNVAHILEGSVRKAGNQVRITAQLIEAGSDTHLWSETYDRTFDDIFAIQDEIAAAVVDALQITLLDKQPKATETDPEAYALYLQGLHAGKQLNAEAMKQAETLLKQALEIDPGFAPAWTELGTVYRYQAVFFSLLPGYELARDAIQRALAIDPQNSPAYAVLHWIERDPILSWLHLQQALVLDPGNAVALRLLGWREFILGRIDDAIEMTQRSIAYDPVSPGTLINLAYMFYVAHRLEAAADSIQMAHALAPNAVLVQLTLSLVLLAQGDAPAALVAIEQEPDDGLRLIGTAIVQHALGDARASDKALQKYIEYYGNAYYLALVYSSRGEIDNAFDGLDYAYDNGEGRGLILQFHPLFANLHDDPRWEPLLDKIRSQLSEIP